MVTKIFTVKEGSQTEIRIRELVEEGVARLPFFEKEMGILDFCLDLEIIENPIKKHYMLMISGYTNRLACYENNDLEEITKERLHTILPKGNIVRFAGTHELIEDAGYQVKAREGNLCEIVLAS
ncbi:hypothetical protein [Bacillus anthracis]|uniref:hypothetical protein n=1 Tax=Bacillus anthracis TaxID=1392 RepID=UPI00099DB7A6|nr:hypothetical protein [Bacillus anthracis]OPD54052.1 hypothetical protein BVG01_29295 [Bacillus anthracis]